MRNASYQYLRQRFPPLDVGIIVIVSVSTFVFVRRCPPRNAGGVFVIVFVFVSTFVFVIVNRSPPWNGGAIVGNVSFESTVEEKVIVLAPPNPRSER